MTNRKVRAAVLALFVGLPAWAESALEPPELSRYLRWGPVRARPGFEIRNLGYDDNIFAGNESEVSDLTATFAPRVDGLVLLGDRAFLAFKEKLEFITYLENSDQSFVNQRGSARLTVPFGRIGVFLDGLLNRVEERPVDQEDLRPERDEDGLGFGMILLPQWRTEIEVGFLHTKWRYSDPDDASDLPGPTIGDRLDRHENATHLKIGYRIRGRTRLTLDARVGEIDFERSPLAGRDSRELTWLPGVDFGEGGPLSGTIRVGRSEIDADGSVSPDLREIVGDADLAYRPNRETTLLLELKREPGYTVQGDSIYFLDTRATLRAVRYLNRVFGLEASGSVGWLTFPSSVDDVDREDDIRRYDVGARFRFSENSMGRRVEYSLKLGRYRRESDPDPGLNRSRTTFGINAVVGF